MTELIVAVLFYLNLLTPYQEFTPAQADAIYEANIETVNVILFDEQASTLALQTFESSEYYDSAVQIMQTWGDDELRPKRIPAKRSEKPIEK